MLRLLAGLVLFLALDEAVFGSGFYFRWASPDSGLGTLLNVMRAAKAAPDGSVLVFGDSRMAEGFSARVANAEAQRLGSSLRFVNSAVPGTTPRVWYYMLRAYRDHGLHPAAVLYMSQSLHDGRGSFNASSASDIAFLPPFLGWKDITTFPLSFQGNSPAGIEALEAVLFKGWLLHGDVEDFLQHPGARLKSVHLWREHGAEWIDNYPGHEDSLAGLTLDPATGAVGWPPGEDKLPPRLRDYIAEVKSNRAEAASPEYAQPTREWYEAAAALCRDMGAKLIVFRAPRGPLHYLTPPLGEAHGALASLAAAGQLQIVGADTFDDLERPEFFFDNLHMNRVGREAFSPRLARETLRILSR